MTNLRLDVSSLIKVSKYLVPLVTGLLLGLASLLSAADVVITSEQKGAETIALGFTDFKCSKGNANTVSFNPGAVLSWDLEFSGRFKVKSSPVFDSASKGLFKSEGALAYVRGEYTFEGDNFTLQCDLMDLETGERIIGKKYSGKKTELRLSSHKFSDELVYQLFGEKGIALSRIVYVTKHAGTNVPHPINTATPSKAWCHPNGADAAITPVVDTSIATR